MNAQGDLSTAELERRLAAVDEFLAEYEAEHGVITEEEMDAAEQRDHANTRVVRGAGDV